MRAGVGVPSSPDSLTSNIGSVGSQTTYAPAVAINASLSLPSSEQARLDGQVQVDIVPLHFFIDLGLVLGCDSALAFLDDVSSGRNEVADYHEHGDENGADEGEDDKDLLIKPQERNGNEREAERQRLERLVLEDLDLGLDYRDPKLTKKEGVRETISVVHTRKVGLVYSYAIWLKFILVYI
jgi:autophagy-related protein 2